MADEEIKVEETTDQNAADETTQTETEQVTEVDYDKEFTEAVEKFETAEKNREGYQMRKSATETTEDEADKVQAEIDAKVAEAIKKQLPKLQSSLAEDAVESALNDLSGGDEAKKKLIRFHFENSVSPNGTIRERMENALLIADKKTILKTQKELAVALQNRQGLSTTGQGTSTEGVEVKDNFFSKDQLTELKAKGWDDAKINRLKANLQKGR